MQRPMQSTLAASVLLMLAAAPLAAEALVTPAETRGTWAHEAAACGNPSSDGRIAIREAEIEFFGSLCRIVRVQAHSASAWAGHFRCEESGEFEEADIELEIPGASADRNRLRLRIDRGEWRPLVRCPRDVPVR